ncbi:MAG TPA: permease [Elusimicrobiales bacterium]|nr:permease [Elusimicrobiales bacterium]
MSWKDEWKTLAALAGAFLVIYFLPVGWPRFDGAVLEGFHLIKWYAREHFLLCLVPAMFIAGAIAVFVSQAAVMKYFGAGANKFLSYTVASVSGTILAVCSCTVLPLFAGIYKRGAGLGPAIAFLYSGPAINVLAITLTARVLGFEMGMARAVAAVVFSVVIGLAMHLLFRDEEHAKRAAQAAAPAPAAGVRPLWQTSLYFISLVGILVFANWGKSDTEGLWLAVFRLKWIITSIFAAGLGLSLWLWFGFKITDVVVPAAAVVVFWALFPGKQEAPFVAGVLALSLVLTRKPGEEAGDWLEQTWGLAKMIVPLLFYGVFAAGFFLGRPGVEGMIHSAWISMAVGGNSILANFFASVVAAFMYFATLTEIPILQGLMGSGMGKGPALALLLAGPALSLQSMLILKQIMGFKKTAAYVGLVVFMSTITGWFYGRFF